MKVTDLINVLLQVQEDLGDVNVVLASTGGTNRKFEIARVCTMKDYTNGNNNTEIMLVPEE